MESVSAITANLMELIKIHRVNVQALSETTFDIIVSRPKKYEGEAVLRLFADEIFATYIFLKQLSSTNQIDNFESRSVMANATFALVYWGLFDDKGQDVIWKERTKFLKSRLNKANDVLRQFSHGADIVFKIPDTVFEFTNRRSSVYQWEKLLRGHSKTLSRYFKHVEQLMLEFERLAQASIGEDEFERLVAFLVAQLSSVEFAVIYFYSLTKQGHDLWEKWSVVFFRLLREVDLEDVPLDIQPRFRLEKHLQMKGVDLAEVKWNEYFEGEGHNMGDLAT